MGRRGFGYTPSVPQPRNEHDDSFVNAFGTEITRDGDDWCVTAMIEGERRVVSRHALREQAEAASAYVNASANRDERDAQP